MSHFGRHGARSFAAVPLPLLRNDTIVEQPANLATLTRRYAEEAIAFTRGAKAADRPFLLYVAFNHVHSPNFRSERMCDVSRRGAVGDAAQELDGSVGTILAGVFDADTGFKEEDVLVFFTSDNGAPLRNDARGNGPLYSSTPHGPRTTHTCSHLETRRALAPRVTWKRVALSLREFYTQSATTQKVFAPPAARVSSLEKGGLFVLSLSLSLSLSQARRQSYNLGGGRARSRGRLVERRHRAGQRLARDRGHLRHLQHRAGAGRRTAASGPRRRHRSLATAPRRERKGGAAMDDLTSHRLTRTTHDTKTRFLCRAGEVAHECVVHYHSAQDKTGQHGPSGVGAARCPPPRPPRRRAKHRDRV